MIRQPSFAEIESLAKSKRTRRAPFLEDMNAIVPWAPLIALIEPYYPKGARCPTIGLERLLRLYFIQQWFGLGDEATEDAVIEKPIFYQFVGIDVLRESVPDESSILNFRRLLEKNEMQVVLHKWRFEKHKKIQIITLL